MSEKEKVQSTEIAKVLAENPTAKIYLAGLAQGMKLARPYRTLRQGSTDPCQHGTACIAGQAQNGRADHF